MKVSSSTLIAVFLHISVELLQISGVTSNTLPFETTTTISIPCTSWNTEDVCKNPSTFNGFKSVNVTHTNSTDFEVSWEPIDDLMYCYDVTLIPNSQFTTDLFTISMVAIIRYANFLYMVRTDKKSIHLTRSQNFSEFQIYTQIQCSDKCLLTESLNITLNLPQVSFKGKNDLANTREIVDAENECDYISKMHPLKQITIGKIENTNVPISWKGWNNVNYCTNQDDTGNFNYTSFDTDFKDNVMVFINYGRVRPVIRDANCILNMCPVVTRKEVEIFAKVKCGGVCIDTMHEIVPLREGVMDYEASSSKCTKVVPYIIYLSLIFSVLWNINQHNT